MRAIGIKITKAHIRDGLRGSECDCPIALALKDALITDNVRVNGDGIYVNNARFDLDDKDRRFMSRFDEGLRVRPYSFSINRTNRK